MPQFAALTYTSDVDWTAAEQADTMAEYSTFGSEARRGDPGRGSALPDRYRYDGACRRRPRRRNHHQGRRVRHTTHALTGFYLVEAPDMPAAIQIAADIPAAWDGAVEVRPVIDVSG